MILINNIIVLDGMKFITKNDNNNNNNVSKSNIELIEHRIGEAGIQPIQQPTELGDTLKELNKDDIEVVSRMSGIDMRARLHHIEVASVLALDALVSLRVIPTKCLAFTRQKKRLSVSIDGKGRDDIVNIVAGKRDMEAKGGMGGFGDKIKGFMGFGGKSE